jgi:hypothetical protein
LARNAPTTELAVHKKGVVRGFIMRQPKMAAALLNLKKIAKARAIRIPSPKVGNIARKTPTARPVATFCGESLIRTRRI